jgi:hypothetical protein
MAIWSRELQITRFGEHSKAEARETAVRLELHLAVCAEYGRDDESGEEPVF